MTLEDALKTLREAGTEPNRKTYRRHGVVGDQFGVSYAALESLRKTIKTDHDLACGLWSSGNHDARILATKIADPARAAAILDDWVRDLDNYVLADALSSLAARSPGAAEFATRWMDSDEEFVAAAGWSVLASLATNDRSLADDVFTPFLDVIESTIHAERNRVKHTMNGALIAIGMRNDILEAMVLKAAARIGKVEVDHGDTSCKTPDAAAYIAKSKTRGRRGAKS